MSYNDAWAIRRTVRYGIMGAFSRVWGRSSEGEVMRKLGLLIPSMALALPAGLSVSATTTRGTTSIWLWRLSTAT